MFLNLFFRNFAAINMVKYSNMKSNLYNKTYDGIPLSIIYNQIIRFLKEKGIYVPYLEISLPQTKLGNYESFINLLINSSCAEYLIRHFFI